MTETLLIIILLVVAAVLPFVVAIFRRPSSGGSLLNRFEVLEKIQERSERSLVDALERNRVDAAAQARAQREELQKTLAGMGTLQKQQLDSFGAQITRLVESGEKKADELRTAVEHRLSQLQTDNAAKLEEMRRTVDEKLQSTLDKRLSESFKQVSERLELVHKGLGEMQTLATGVGDLKRVLTNVKTRGTWGEVQLGALLEQLLVPEQYGKNVVTRPGSNQRVEYAIRLPGGEGQQQVWLPIDSKFPTDDYERLVAAQERADPVALEEAA